MTVAFCPVRTYGRIYYAHVANLCSLYFKANLYCKSMKTRYLYILDNVTAEDRYDLAYSFKGPAF